MEDDAPTTDVDEVPPWRRPQRTHEERRVELREKLHKAGWSYSHIDNALKSGSWSNPTTDAQRRREAERAAKHAAKEAKQAAKEAKQAVQAVHRKRSIEAENYIERKSRIDKQARPTKIVLILFVLVSLPLIGALNRFFQQALGGSLWIIWALGAFFWFMVWCFAIWKWMNWDHVAYEIEAQRVQQEEDDTVETGKKEDDTVETGKKEDDTVETGKKEDDIPF